MGMSEEGCIEWGVVADGHIKFLAESGHIMVMDKVRRIIVARALAPFADNFWDQAVHLDGVGIVGLKGIVVAVEFFLDLKEADSTGAPGSYMKGREAEHGEAAR